MTTRRTRGPYRKSAARREQILQAAYEAIDEHGERASLQDIAERVGVTQPALTYYFPTRDELLIAVLEHRDVLSRATVSGAQRPENMTESMVASTHLITDHPGLAKLYLTLAAASTDPDSPVHSYFLGRYQNLATEVTEALEAAQRAGAVRSDLPAAHLARAVLAVLDGLQTQWMHDPTVDIAAIAETFARLLATPAIAPGRPPVP